MNVMKATLVSLLTAALLGTAYFATNQNFDAGTLTAALFTVGLVGWTMAQYGRVSRPINLERPIRFPTPVRVTPRTPRTARLAA